MIHKANRAFIILNVPVTAILTRAAITKIFEDVVIGLIYTVRNFRDIKFSDFLLSRIQKMANYHKGN